MLPPLVVSEAEIADAVARIDRAAIRLEQTHKLGTMQGAAE
jgi:acetylornithine/succinyldiaminopimelate/putrescine aminotransferase